MGQNSNDAVNLEEDTEIAGASINDVVIIENVVRIEIVQTVRDNQLITTQVQTLPPSPPTARLRQMLIGPDTRSTRIPKYKDTTTQEKLAIVPHGSADDGIEGAVSKKSSHLAKGMGETHVVITIDAMKIDPKITSEASVDAGTSKTAEKTAGNGITMNCNPLFDVNIVRAGPGNQACPEK
ncbi:unnamed protein product [Trifolium pratense]|uniref:Uncharacterized protein n=1 Tax=Trifolium pratense TaxID=57577 RepID=A0ACB0JRK2_TRIPR|nr:unnamed protein product [Trifolium pratense]